VNPCRIVWDGAAPNHYFGRVVAGIGDVNNDGIPDVAIGAPEAPSTTGTIAGAGRVQIYTGPNGAPLLLFGGLSGQVAGDNFGSAIAGWVDVNGNGVREIVVGIRKSDAGGTDSGQVKIIEATGLTVLTLNGAAAFDEFGAAVAVLGDFNGDGKPEFAVGAPLHDPAAPDSGRVTVYSGATGAVFLTPAMTPFVVNGSLAAAQLGFAIAAAGDVNDDGTPDLAVGAPFDSPPGVFLTNHGSVRVISGTDASVLWTAYGSADHYQFGKAVTGIGDTNGDGHDDVLAGGPHPGFGIPGQALVLSGATGTPLLTVNGTAGSDLFGASVAGLDDVDGDGSPDFAVGAPQVSNQGAVTVFSGSSGKVLTRSRGESSGAKFGTALAPAGDFDGDGNGDLLVGNPEESLVACCFQGRATLLKRLYQPPFASGCAGSGGLVPGIHMEGYGPCVDTPVFGVGVDNAIGASLATLVFGAGTLVPPINLDPLFGSAGCNLHVVPDGFIVVSTSGTGPGAGTASLLGSIPNLPVLAGASIYFQWYVVDPGPFPIPGALTAGLQVTIL